MFLIVYFLSDVGSFRGSATWVLKEEIEQLSISTLQFNHYIKA